jgi:DASH complex subunit DAM1
MSQHRTPIKRISQGSLRALSRSTNYPDAPHGLGFLTPALAELTEEMQTLQSHTQGLRDLENSLTRFNESFASWLYVQNMASLTLDWTQVPFFLIDPNTRSTPPLQAPIPASFLLAKQRAGDPFASSSIVSPSPLSPPVEQDAIAAQAALTAATIPLPDPPQQSAVTEQSELDPDSTSITSSVRAVNSSAKVVKKVVVKKKLTAKEKRERGVTIYFLSLSVFLV